MKTQTTRRNFIKKAAIGTTAAFFPHVLIGMNKNKTDIPMIDYHVHLTGDFTIEDAVTLSRQRNIKFGIVEHPGHEAPIQNDVQLKNYLDMLDKYPVYKGLQPMYLNWAKDFSKKLLSRLDYVFMDADTIPLPNNEYLRIWRHDNYIENLDSFMELYMTHIVNILKNEPIDIFGRPTYLPVNFARYYDRVWTKKRINTIIDLAKQKNIAFEISTPMHVPNKEFILLAKAKGLKFALGTNARNQNAGKFHYGLEMIKECGLTRDDMFQI